MTGEKEIFFEIWAEREHVCTNCGEFLPEFNGYPLAYYFAHLRGKGANPELRLVKENIELHCFICHRLLDQGTSEQYLTRSTAPYKRYQLLKSFRDNIPPTNFETDLNDFIQ